MKGKDFDKTIFSKHFIVTGVRATGLKSFICFIQLFLGTGIIFEVFHEVGILQAFKDILKIAQYIKESCRAQSFKILGVTPSAPQALLGFNLQK